MTLEEKLRLLVIEAQTTEVRLNLRQVATKCGVEYNRLWRFMDPRKPDTLGAADAQRIYDTLSTTPLIPSDDI
jgi:hypothetical protein